MAPGTAEEMNRFMVAVLRTNPQSFYQDNVNALRGGAVLTLPTPAQIAAIDPADAAEVVRTHNDLWRQYAQSAAAQPTRLADTGTGTSAPTPPAAGSPDSRLELVPPSRGDGQGAADAPGRSANAGNAEEVTRLQRDLQTRREELTSAQKELEEMRSRVRDLESLKGKQDALIKLKDDEIAQLQARLAEINREVETARTAAAEARNALAQATPPPAAAAPAVPEPAVPEPVTPEPAPAEPAAALPDPAPAEPEPVASTDTPADGDIWGGADPAASDTDTVVTDAPEPAPAPALPAPAPTPPAATPAPVEPAPAAATGGLFSLPVIGGVLGLLVAGIGGFLWHRSRRGKPDRRQSLPPIMPVDADSPPALTVDPEEDLRDRIAMNPMDLSAHLELLRYLHGESRLEAYEAASEAMYRYVDNPDCDEWREAVMLGADLMPEHPRFAAVHGGLPANESAAAGPSDLGDLDVGRLDSPATPPAAPSVPDFKFDFNASGAAGAATLELSKPAPIPAPAPAPPPASDFDFNFDNLLAPAPAPAPAPVASSFDFELPEPKPAPSGFDFELPAPTAAAAPDLGFDVDSNGSTKRVEPVAAPTPAPVDPSNDFSFDFDSLLSPAPAPAAPARPSMDEQRTDTMALPDLDSLMSSLAPASAPPGPTKSTAASDLSLDLSDLDLNFDGPGSPVADFKPIELDSRLPSQPASALEQPDVIPLDASFDLDDPSFLGGDDAIATKLDLARAYIDMSDPDGARAMLEEVLLEGSEAQKSEAREILARIG